MNPLHYRADNDADLSRGKQARLNCFINETARFVSRDRVSDVLLTHNGVLRFMRKQ